MTGDSYFWTNIFFLAVGTILIRGSIIALSSKIVISNRVKELFSFIPAAILPAFIAPAVFYHQGHIAVTYGKERFVILVFATLVSFLTKSTLATIAFGLASLYFINQF